LLLNLGSERADHLLNEFFWFEAELVGWFELVLLLLDLHPGNLVPVVVVVDLHLPLDSLEEIHGGAVVGMIHLAVASCSFWRKPSI